MQWPPLLACTSSTVSWSRETRPGHSCLQLECRCQHHLRRCSRRQCRCRLENAHVYVNRHILTHLNALHVRGTDTACRTHTHTHTHTYTSQYMQYIPPPVALLSHIAVAFATSPCCPDPVPSTTYGMLTPCVRNVQNVWCGAVSVLWLACFPKRRRGRVETVLSREWTHTNGGIVQSLTGAIVIVGVAAPAYVLSASRVRSIMSCVRYSRINLRKRRYPP